MERTHDGPIIALTTENLTGQFTNRTLDFRLPCTATGNTSCQIVNHLSSWNEFLCTASWQLKKMPGTTAKLALVFFRDQRWICCSSREMRLAIQLVCELLKSHCCVSHVDLDIQLCKAHFETLLDALRANASIRSVKFLFRGWINVEYLVVASRSLPKLQELEYSGFTPLLPNLVAGINTFLQTTTSLTALRLPKGWPVCSREGSLGIGQNCSMKELVLPSTSEDSTPRGQAAFAEQLMNSVSLKSLTVASDVVERCLPLKCILEAVRANRSIIRVVFDIRKFHPSDVKFVSKIFEENKVLRSFKMLYAEDIFLKAPFFAYKGPGKADSDRCLKALIQNHTLEEVCLPCGLWDEDQWKELFRALPAKRNLKKVSIEALRRASPFFVRKLCAALKETGADEKVSFSISFSEKEFDEMCTCKAFSSVVLTASNDNRAAVFGMLQRMPSLVHITRLHLCLCLHMLAALDRSLSSVLASFLWATRTLKTLALCASWEMLQYDCQKGLIDGLARNVSLREVRIDVHDGEDHFSSFSEPFADAVVASRNISRVHLGVWSWAQSAFFQRLSTGIADNYLLLSVTVPDCTYSERHWFKVWDTTKRNSGLLTDAADYARGTRRDRCCGQALDRMQSHPELVKEVAMLEEVDEARAAAMVRDGLQSMDGLHDFMRLAGVVRKQVSCYAREDGRTQLDALNEHCWSAVRRYVKLYDIEESTPKAP